MRIIKFTIILLSSIVLVSCVNNNEKEISTDVVKNNKTAIGNYEKGTAPKMYFEETVHDFGNIIQGERLVYGFEFTNIGGSDLVITRVSSSCGCTVGDYPKQSIKPGKTGVIEVTFDSKGRRGIQNKTVTILANTEPNSTTLRIKGKVIQPERE